MSEANNNYSDLELRTLSDAEKIKGGARYVSDSETNAPRLQFTAEQVNEAKKEMEREIEERLIKHEKQIVEEAKKAMDAGEYKKATLLIASLEQHIEIASGECKLKPNVGDENETESGETPYEMIDMSSLIREDNLKDSYYAGSQLEILQDAFDVEWVILEQEEDYSGEYVAVFKNDGRWAVFNGYFGSCSGCDDLEDANPVEWLQDHVKNVRAFDSKQALVKWLNETEDYSFQAIKGNVIAKLGEVE